MEKELLYISRLCDQNNIPFASNVATAEMLVPGLRKPRAISEQPQRAALSAADLRTPL